MSNYEELLNKIINGEDISNYVPQSRFEQILKDKFTGAETLVPVNIGEALLIQVLGSSSGGGGSSSSKDMLQARVDALNSCEYLMYGFKGTDVSFLSKLNTSKVTSTAYMFQNCSYITEVPLFDTKNVTNMQRMFYSCPALETIPAFNATKVTNMSSAFSYSYKLKTILMYGMKVSFDISASTEIAREDLVTILNNLGTVTTATTLTMGSTNLAKLTDTDKEIATNKGWTLA